MHLIPETLKQSEFYYFYMSFGVDFEFQYKKTDV